MNSRPPPLPSGSRNPLDRRRALLIILALIPTSLFGILIALRLLGLICPYSIPTGSMEPAVSAGDHIMMENITYLFRQPRRGDVVVFKSDGIENLPGSTRYVKRVVGMPGEHVLLSDERLFINDQLTTISNDFGKIAYPLPVYPKMYTPPQLVFQTNLTVPDKCYFLVGDRATNSFDSRNFGSVPRSNITGQIWFCYWPPQRMGLVK